MVTTLTGSHRVAISAFGERLLDILNVILVTRKSLFLRAVNAMFGKDLRIATEDTILHLNLDQVYPNTALWSGRLSSQCCVQAIT